ncbi:MAG: hypothetical protein NVS1B9_08500 [Solirubrobacteraceae bacterium]
MREASTRRPEAAPAAPSPPGTIPPAGWEPLRADAASELQALAQLFGTLRELLPADLQQQVTDLIRQLLILLRSLIDWAVSQIDGGVRGQEYEIEDIPIN